MALFNYTLSDQLAGDLDRSGLLSPEGVKSLLVDGWSREIAKRSLPVDLSELDKIVVKLREVPSEKVSEVTK